MPKTRFNRDRMNMIPTREAATATMRIIDGAQDLPPEHQLVAITATFKLMIERFGVTPSDAFTVADNIMHHAQGRRVEFDAVALYLENEL